MKTAIYIEDGAVQLVLTPESDFEENALASFSTAPLDVGVFNGSFYGCRGGWVRQSDNYGSFNESSDKSLILRIAPPNDLP